MRSSLFCRPHYSTGSINESTNNQKYHISSRIVFSLHNSMDFIIYKTSVQIKTQILREKAIRSSVNCKAHPIPGSAQLTAPDIYALIPLSDDLHNRDSLDGNI